jgi:hypothetical protein
MTRDDGAQRAAAAVKFRRRRAVGAEHGGANEPHRRVPYHTADPRSDGGAGERRRRHEPRRRSTAAAVLGFPVAGYKRRLGFWGKPVGWRRRRPIKAEGGGLGVRAATRPGEARHGPESGAARRTGRDDRRGPHVSGWERRRARKQAGWATKQSWAGLQVMARGRGENQGGTGQTSLENGPQRKQLERRPGS